MSVLTDQSLFTCQLGDIVCLPEGRRASIRALLTHLPRTVGSMAGFALAGEIGPSCVLLSIPERPVLPIGLYVPMPRVPGYARDAVEVASGVVSYWAPHSLPISGAMGELGYKVAQVRGQVEPMVLLWRGEEMVVFVYSTNVDPAALVVEQLVRDQERSEQFAPQHAARVTSPEYEAPQPDPAWEPSHAPQYAPVG